MLLKIDTEVSCNILPLHTMLQRPFAQTLKHGLKVFEEVELMSKWIWASKFLRYTNCFLKWLGQFALLSIVYDSACLPHTLWNTKYHFSYILSMLLVKVCCVIIVRTCTYLIWTGIGFGPFVFLDYGIF